MLAKQQKLNEKTRGAMTCSKAQWYECCEKNNKYFYNLEKKIRRKNITSLTKEDGNISLTLKIFRRRGTFFQGNLSNQECLSRICQSRTFFDGLNTLKQEEADTCEGLLTLEECTKSLKQFMNNKTPGSDGFTIEFYRFFWNAIGPIMVDSFNYAFEMVKCQSGKNAV